MHIWPGLRIWPAYIPSPNKECFFCETPSFLQIFDWKQILYWMKNTQDMQDYHTVNLAVFLLKKKIDKIFFPKFGLLHQNSSKLKKNLKMEQTPDSYNTQMSVRNFKLISEMHGYWKTLCQSYPKFRGYFGHWKKTKTLYKKTAKISLSLLHQHESLVNS